MAISLLFLFSFFFVTFVTPAFATVTVTAVTDLTAGQGILPGSLPTALLRVQVTFAAGDTYLKSMPAAVRDSSGLGSSDISRLSIYRDNGDGVFSSADAEVAFKTDPVPGTTYPLSFNDAAGTWGPTRYYFIVVKTSGTIAHADAFYGWLGAITGTPGGTSGTFYGSASSVVRCECKIVDVFYDSSFHLEELTPPLVSASKPWDLYWHPNNLSYSIRTEMTEPNEGDPAGDPHAWYLTELGNYRYSFVTGGPSTADQLTDYTYAYSNLLKFERKRQLLQMQAPTAILGIKVSGKNQFQSTTSGYYDSEYLDTMVVAFTDTDSPNFRADQMLFPLNTSSAAESGVALYRDNNHNGILDAGDTPVDLWSNEGWLRWDSTGNIVTFDFTGTLGVPVTAIPQTNDAETSGDSDSSWDITYLHDRTGTDFLVVIRAMPQTALDSKIAYGADFTAKVTILSFTSGISLNSITRSQWYETREIKAALELSDLTGSRADPDSPFPVLGINCVDGPGLYEKISSITFQIKDEIGFNPDIDIDNVYIYQNSTHNGVFNPGDSPATGITKTAWSLTGGWWQTIIYASPGLDVPDTDTGLDQSDDYYVVLRTSENFGYLDKLTCRILDGGVVFNGTTASTLGTGLATNALLLPSVNDGRIYWDSFASPATPLTGNVSVKFHDSSSDLVLAAGSGPAAVLGLELASNTSADTQPVLKSLVVQLINTTTGKTNVDMSDLSLMTTDSSTSGLGIWEDDGDGEFNPVYDTPLPMAAPPSQDISNPAENYKRFLIVLSGAKLVNDTFSGHSDYFVTIKTKAEAADDQFVMRLWGSEMKPPASYGLGFRTTAQSAFPGDTVTTTEAATYSVTGVTATDTGLTLSPALGGSVSDYNPDWYLVITAGADTAKGKVRKIISATGLNDITCEDLTGLGVDTTSEIRVFKLNGTSYQNHSVGIVFSGAYSVTLSAGSTATSIILTALDGTPVGAKTFIIERWDVTAYPSTPTWITLTGTPTLVGTNTYQYIDTSGLVIGNTYNYRVTVTVSGGGTYVSNTVSAKLATFFLDNRPTDLRASAGIKVVELDWDWPNGYKILEDGFSIERKGEDELEASFTVIGTTNQYPYDNFGRYTDQSFTDTMLADETTYDYRVRAFKYTLGGTAYSDSSNVEEIDVMPRLDIPASGGGGGAVGPLAVGISVLLGWWKRRRKVVRS